MYVDRYAPASIQEALARVHESQPVISFRSQLMRPLITLSQQAGVGGI